MIILVTGSGGYIGGSFCYEALKRGFKVTGIDNFSNSLPDTTKKLKNHFQSQFTFVEADLLDKRLQHFLPKDKVYDAIFHFAALKSIPDSEKNPDLYFRNNVEGTNIAIKLAENMSIRRFIFSSSAAIYGKQDTQPICETASLEPNSVYAETKKISEELVQEATRKNILNAISLRYFNPIGSHEDSLISDNYSTTTGNIMSMIIKAALGMEKYIEVFGDDYDTNDGTGERDYIHISDVVLGHFFALEKIDKIKRHEAYNLGTGKSISVLKIIKIFERVNNIKINTIKANRREGDVSICYANPSKAHRELNWQAIYSLESMCKDAWEAVQNDFR